MLGHFALGEQALGGVSDTTLNNLHASPGVFVLAGQSVQIKRQYVLHAGAGAYVVRGYDAIWLRKKVRAHGATFGGPSVHGLVGGRAVVAASAGGGPRLRVH